MAPVDYIWVWVADGLEQYNQTALSEEAMRWILLLLLLLLAGNKLTVLPREDVSDLYAKKEDHAVKKNKFNVHEYEYTPKPPQGCVSLQATSGAGKTQAAAKSAVYSNVVSAGGNALMFYRGKTRLDTKTSHILKVTYYATIYKCENN